MSITKYCIGEYQIIILDDGTKDAYLNKVKQKFPSIVLKKSPLREEKIKIIDANIKSNENIVWKLKIPANFWLENILADNNDYFMIIEDDMWFVDEINLNQIKLLFENNSLKLLKLASYGNKKVNSGRRQNLSVDIDIIKPKLPIQNSKLFNLFIDNKLKCRSIYNKLSGIKNEKYLLKYYTIYSVAGAVYNKLYYKYLWDGFNGTVNEFIQLKKAVQYFSLNKNKVLFATYNKDKIKTSFSSSATNIFPGVNLNVFRYNHILNETWYNGLLDPMDNHPDDFSVKTIKKILKSSSYNDVTFKEWQKWKSIFEGRYKELGFKI